VQKYEEYDLKSLSLFVNGVLNFEARNVFNVDGPMVLFGTHDSTIYQRPDHIELAGRVEEDGRVIIVTISSGGPVWGW
jgi:hypothetical protein